ncbi:MAG: hypothetical protein Kow009_04430 [Spirochaetales bacterium]
MVKCIHPQVETLRELLQKEVDMFHRYIDLERELQERILSRKWKDLTAVLKSLKQVAQNLTSIEEDRDTVYRELRNFLQVGEGESFYDFCFRFPEEIREELVRLHRELKHAVVVVEGITSGIDVYCATTASTLGSVMDTLVPGWKHRVYSQKGTPMTSSQPLLVNQSL